MASTNINTGAPIRFVQYGELVIFTPAGSDDVTIYNIVDGTSSFDIGRTEPIPITDRGERSEVVLSGDEMPPQLRCTVKLNPGGLEELLDAILPADSSGQKALYKVEVDLYDTPAKTAGRKLAYNKCFCVEMPQIQTSSGADVDTVSFVLQDEGAGPTVSTIGA